MAIRDKTPPPNFHRKPSNYFDDRYPFYEGPKTAQKVITERNKKIDDHMRQEEQLKHYNLIIQ